MTTIDPLSPTVRETKTVYRGRPLVVELHGGFLVIRRKGIPRERLSLDYQTVYEAACKRVALAERRDKWLDDRRRKRGQP